MVTHRCQSPANPQLSTHLPTHRCLSLLTLHCMAHNYMFLFYDLQVNYKPYSQHQAVSSHVGWSGTIPWASLPVTYGPHGKAQNHQYQDQEYETGNTKEEVPSDEKQTRENRSKWNRFLCKHRAYRTFQSEWVNKTGEQGRLEEKGALIELRGRED